MTTISTSWKPLWRAVLAFAVLACVLLIQNPALQLLHNHTHSGPHSDCCPACHAAHNSAAPAVQVAFEAPAIAGLWAAAEEAPAAASRVTSEAVSRAPPA